MRGGVRHPIGRETPGCLQLIEAASVQVSATTHEIVAQGWWRMNEAQTRLESHMPLLLPLSPPLNTPPLNPVLGRPVRNWTRHNVDAVRPGRRGGLPPPSPAT